MKSQINCEWLQMTGNSLVETKKYLRKSYIANCPTN